MDVLTEPSVSQFSMGQEEEIDDRFVLTERLSIDRELVTKLILSSDIAAVLAAEGFEISDRFLGYVERSVKILRTAIHDQVEVLHNKARRMSERMFNSGNSAVDW